MKFSKIFFLFVCLFVCLFNVRIPFLVGVQATCLVDLPTSRAQNFFSEPHGPTTGTGNEKRRTFEKVNMSCFCNRSLNAMHLICFRPGFYVQQLTKVPAGTYDVIPSTFYPGQEGPFILTISASCKLALGRK